MGFDGSAFVLGIIQGVTEFLPVSSSGHLALLQSYFTWGNVNLLAYDLLLHCATMLAVLIFFREDILLLLSQWFGGFIDAKKRASEGWRTGWAILAGTVITAMVALPLKNAVEFAMTSRMLVGAGLLVTAALLCIVPLLPERHRALSIRTVLIVGLVQGVAVFPGVSRSGSTIATALALGLAAPEAFRLSFLMSVPAIAGASLLEFLKLWKAPVQSLPEGWLFGFLAAFILGWISLVLLRRLVLSGKWAYFGVYCFFLGLLAIVSEIATMF